MTDVLSVAGLTAGYGKIPIVNDISFNVGLSQVVTIVGPNGAGKSTALKATFGLVNRFGGAIHLDGEPVSDLPTHALAWAGMGYVPQVENVFATMTVQENLSLGGLAQTTKAKSRDASRRSEVFDIFPDLALARNKKAGQLSGGQRNMLGMARALMSDPKIILLDEPTAGLSPANVDVVWAQIRRIADLGTSILVVEQNVARALRQADWVYVLVAGSNYLAGSASTLEGVDLGAIFLGATHPGHLSLAKGGGSDLPQHQPQQQ